MTYSDEFDLDAFLTHYGVKGMRWGIRKAQHPSYSDDQVGADRKRFGDRGAKRINSRLIAGKTHEQAVRSEKRRKIVKTAALVLYGGLVARNLMQRHGPRLAAHIANKRATQAGARAAAETLSKTHGLTRFSEINLGFNAATNTWE